MSSSPSGTRYGVTLKPSTAPCRTNRANFSASPAGVPTCPRCCGPSSMTASRSDQPLASAFARHRATTSRGSSTQRVPNVPLSRATTGSSAGSGSSASRPDRSMPHSRLAMPSATAGVTCESRTQRAFSSASFSVAPMTISVPGRMRSASSARPAARSLRRMSSAKARASSKSVPCAEKMTSAFRAPKSRPSPESPAWKITGCPWALRGSVGVRSTSNWAPRDRTRPTPPGTDQERDSTEPATESSAQPFQTARATVRNSSARR